jgi:hypothetical protein
MLTVFIGKDGSLISCTYPLWEDLQGETSRLQRNAWKSILHLPFIGKEGFYLNKLVQPW